MAPGDRRVAVNEEAITEECEIWGGEIFWQGTIIFQSVHDSSIHAFHFANAGEYPILGSTVYRVPSVMQSSEATS